jgi:guanine deaminase
MEMKGTILKGDIVYTMEKDRFELHEDAYLVSEEGRVIGVFNEIPAEYQGFEVIDHSGKLIIPAFTDLHTHANQYANKGLGYDRELLGWLNTYTFPEEEKFRDLAYSECIYKRFITELIREGTLNVVAYGSVFQESTRLLIHLLQEAGIRAYVGKVNMDRNTSASMIEETEVSIMETEELILEFEGSDLVRPIITPRFIPTCSPALLKGLGDLARKYDIPVQSHLNETLAEVNWVRQLNPDGLNYASVYLGSGLFGQTRTIMAHCIHSTKEEVAILKSQGVYAAHCPDSNLNLSSGIMPVRMFLNEGIPVGLGTDIAGGESLSIRHVMVSAIKSSKLKFLESGHRLKPLGMSEAFYLATKGGGAFFGDTGSFEKGYWCDALVINDARLCLDQKLTLRERVERFVYNGTREQIIERYFHGELIEPGRLWKKEQD